MALPQKLRAHFNVSATNALLALRRSQSIATAQPRNKIGAMLHNLSCGVYNNSVLSPPHDGNVVLLVR